MKSSILYLILLAIIVVVGAVSGRKTLTNTFAISLDVLLQCVGINSKLRLTISTRCGLAARRGKLWGARCVNFLMRSPTHCEDAILDDIVILIASLETAFDGNPPPEFLTLQSRVHLDYKIR